MKIKVHMKDPDTLQDAIMDALMDVAIEGVNEDEMATVREARFDKVQSLASRWFKYGEYLTVEIDTEAETCTVVPLT